MSEESPTLDKIFSSKGRVKILSLLSRVPELNISEIAKQTNLNYATIEKHLRDLTVHGITREKKFGRIRVYELDKKNRRSQLIRNFIHHW